MKKLLCIIMIMLLSLTMVACDSTSDKDKVIEDSNGVDNNDNNDNNNNTGDTDNTDEDGEENTSDTGTDNSQNETVDNSDLTADELFKQASEYYRELVNFRMEQKIYSCIINYSDLTAEPVIYPTLNKVSSLVYNNPFSFVSNVNYNYFDGKDNNSLDGIVSNNIVIEQYGELIEGREIKIYENFSKVWNNITVSQEEFVKNDNIGSKYIMNYGYYFRNGEVVESNDVKNNEIIVANYDLTDEFAIQLFMNYGFQNFVKSNNSDELKAEILAAMKDSKLTVYFDKNSHKILSMKIKNPSMISHLRQIVAVNHIEELSEETYVQLLESFGKLEIYSEITFLEENVEKEFEIPKEALK